MADTPAYLVTGSEEVLVRREAERIIESLGGSGDLDVTDLRVDDLKEQGIPDLRTGSLFGNPRAVRIRQAQDLSTDQSTALLTQLEGAPPDATLILEATGTGRIRKLAKRIDELGGRIDAAPPKEWEEAKWIKLVGDEFTRHGRKADEAAKRAILDHAGFDLGGIVEKVAQVAAGRSDDKVTAEHVEAVVVGHGNRGAFAVADAMCDRDAANAVALLWGAYESGQDPLQILGALTYRVRCVVAVAGGVDGKSIGTPISSGQKGRLEGVKRNFGPGELTRAYRTLADADLAIKSGELAADQVVEQAVIDIATPR